MKTTSKLKYFLKYASVSLSLAGGMIFKKKKTAMESKTKNKKNREQITGMVEKAFPGYSLAAEENAITELKEGWFNAAYNVRLSDGREVILKVAPPKNAEVMIYEKNIMATEVSSMRMVAKNPSIPVPEIYFYDDSHELCDSDYFFMQKLTGDNLQFVKKSMPKELQIQIDHQIGEIIHQINSITGSYFGYPGNHDLQANNWKETFIKIMDALLEDARRKNADLFYSYEEIRSAILKHSSALDAVTTPVLVHWDAWDLNFFAKDGKITGLLDFERALWADPLMEAQFRVLAYSGITESLKAYGKTTFSHEEDERNHLYSLHLALVMKTECTYRNYDTNEVRNMALMLLLPTMKWLQEND
jgi:aminoglycoside phosphotransferase (APT) family kinase protein